MIKRMNKITSLVVAATAVVSLVPATGVNAAERLATQEGTIEAAIPFKDGKYLFEGYKSEDDESGLYFNNGTKDVLVEDAEDATIETRYGTKYAVVKDGSDEYLVDLTTGKVLDEERDEYKENLSVKLRTSLKKTDRYEFLKNNGGLEVDEVKGDFTETWYKYTATTTGAIYYGFTDGSGKYIDASHIAKMKVVTDKNTVVEVNEFGKGKDGVTVELKDITVIAQDKDNLYTLTKVTTGAAVDLTYVQKISKAQGEKEDGAYLPKKVESYEISSAYDQLKDKNDATENAANAATTLAKLIEKPDSDDVKVSAINGNLYVTLHEKKNNKDTVKVTVLNLKKDKIKLGGKNVGINLVEEDTDDTQDIAGEKAFSIDVDGNTWALNKGTIYKFNGKEFKEVYTCDRSLNILEVYNEKSLIAWEKGEDVYTTVQGKSTNEDVVVKAGWVQDANGAWSFVKADGAKATGWLNDNGTWYYLDAAGNMVTGWLNDRGTWYYLNPVSNGFKGAMLTGWQNVNGTWYYLQSSGAMKTGWLNDNGTWYYLQSNGAMAANTTVDGYVLGASGAWVK